MHLILGVDESPCSRVATEFVRRMTWPAGTTATVVDALPYVMAVVPEAYLVVEQMEETRRQQAEANRGHTGAVAAELTRAGIVARGLAADGDPRTVLVDLAKQEHADLVIVGSHGRTGLARLLLGSVAAHVTTHAPCSVLVVRDPAAKGGAT
jgi:nucleotide-binding universal stress UspA family protein